MGQPGSDTIGGQPALRVDWATWGLECDDWVKENPLGQRLRLQATDRGGWYEPRRVLSLQFRVANSSSCSPHMICTGLPRGAPGNSSTVAFIDMRARLESKIDSQRNR
jgi:hypothetical protein